MSMPKPATRLAVSSDGSNGDTPSSHIGLRWSFVLQTPHNGTHVIVETARREHNQLKFKLPQMNRLQQRPKPDGAICDLLETPLLATAGASGFKVLGMSEAMRTVLPAGFKDENVLEIIYVHVLLMTTHAFRGNDFLKPMAPQELLETCQSYRHAHYRRILKQFGLL